MKGTNIYGNARFGGVVFNNSNLNKIIIRFFSTNIKREKDGIIDIKSRIGKNIDVVKIDEVNNRKLNIEMNKNNFGYSKSNNKYKNKLTKFEKDILTNLIGSVRFRSNDSLFILGNLHIPYPNPYG